MRVIAGSARSLKLKTLDGLDTRPTTDKIKETLFNILNPYLYDSFFLDLFAGSGGIGIEALSRGAREAVFVERSPKAMACIQENIAHTHLADRAVTIRMDVMRALESLKREERQFDFIFMDPPYQEGLEAQVLSDLADGVLLSDKGIVIVEAAYETDFSFVEDLGFVVVRTKKYRTNKHVFLEPAGREEIC